MQSDRIQLVDALRGFSLFAIVLLHSIEHFGIFGQANLNPLFFNSSDKLIEDTLFFLFSGKAYSIFALLMGFSFWVQYERRKSNNENFAIRYSWRLLLLLIIGLAHAAFYSGDILVLYAITGFILIITYKAPNWLLILLSILLLAEPLGLYRTFSLINTDSIGIEEIKIRTFYKAVKVIRMDGSIPELLSGNLQYGLRGNNAWNWEHGRVFQTPGLFLVGVIVARIKLFQQESIKIWLPILLFSAFSFIFIEIAGNKLLEIINTNLLQKHVSRVLTGYKNLAFTSLLIALFIICWNKLKGYKWLNIFVPYGKMSLSNYIFQGFIGIFIFQGVGLRLFPYTGATLCVIIGLLIFITQLQISKLHLRRFKQGPIEFAWRKLTWAKISR